ncbi:FHA domain-containing protein [bacterium]|nr:FHA domain-containing protein [bacterium]
MDVDELARAATKLDEVGFRKRYPDPALVFLASFAKIDKQKIETAHGRTRIQLEEAGATTETRERTEERPTTKASTTDGVSPAYEVLGKSLVVFLQKAGRNPFANMITVGRASNNDVPLAFQTVTKFHAYFMRSSEGAWLLYDQHSTNGTFVDEKRLVAGGSSPVIEGSRISFGPDIHAKFFTPEGLFGFLSLYRAGVASG